MPSQILIKNGCLVKRIKMETIVKRIKNVLIVRNPWKHDYARGYYQSEHHYTFNMKKVVSLTIKPHPKKKGTYDVGIFEEKFATWFYNMSKDQAAFIENMHIECVQEK